jgi:hypothetical protein
MLGKSNQPILFSTSSVFAKERKFFSIRYILTTVLSAMKMPTVQEFWRHFVLFLSFVFETCRSSSEMWPCDHHVAHYLIEQRVPCRPYPTVVDISPLIENSNLLEAKRRRAFPSHVLVNRCSGNPKNDVTQVYWESFIAVEMEQTRPIRTNSHNLINLIGA